MKEYTMESVRIAVSLAFNLFGDKIRKGDGTPYIGHLFRVLGIVQEGSGDFRAQVGAVLHDVMEDVDDGERLIRVNFGDDMVKLVSECSDTDVRPKPNWKERKSMHIAHMPNLSDDALRIILADKIDNGKGLCRLANYADLSAFNTTPQEQLWYLKSVSDLMKDLTIDIKGVMHQVDELSKIVEEFEDLIR